MLNTLPNSFEDLSFQFTHLNINNAHQKEQKNSNYSLNCHNKDEKITLELGNYPESLHGSVPSVGSFVSPNSPFFEQSLSPFFSSSSFTAGQNPNEFFTGKSNYKHPTPQNSKFHGIHPILLQKKLKLKTEGSKDGKIKILQGFFDKEQNPKRGKLDLGWFLGFLKRKKKKGKEN